MWVTFLLLEEKPLTAVLTMLDFSYKNGFRAWTIIS